MNDEADNVVPRLLREMRSDMATKVDMKAGFDQARADTSDLRHDVSEGFTRLTAALTVIAHRLQLAS